MSVPVGDGALIFWPQRRVAKAPIDPFSKSGFDQIVVTLANALVRGAAVATREDVRALLGSLDINWTRATDAKLKALESRITSRMASAAAKAAAFAGPRLAQEGGLMARRAWASSRQKWDLGIAARMDLQDQRAIARVGSDQANFVRDFYTKQIDPALSVRAASVVTDGMSRGLSSNVIAGQLRSEMGGLIRTRSDSYYSVVSSSYMNRARSWSSLVGFQDSGVQRYLIIAVLDERTTQTCRWLDGQLYDVDQSLEVLRRVEQLEDPRDVVDTQPWLVERKIQSGPDRGKLGIFVPEKGGQATLAAIVKTPGRGHDDRGRITTKLSPGRMMARGVGPPPYHGLCRTTIEPE